MENELDNTNKSNEQKDPKAIEVISADPSKSGGAVPPPPPPPPFPQPTVNKIEETVLNSNINRPIRNPYANDVLNRPVDARLNPEVNQPQPQEQPIDFEGQLRNRLRIN